MHGFLERVSGVDLWLLQEALFNRVGLLEGNTNKEVSINCLNVVEPKGDSLVACLGQEFEFSGHLLERVLVHADWMV